MGIRYILPVTCPQCGFEDDDVYFAPTCDHVNWKCPECGHVVDLVALTGISYEDASNAAEIAEICREMLKQACKVEFVVHCGECSPIE